MTDIEVDRGQWGAQSNVMRERVLSVVTEVGALTTGDGIVPTDDAAPVVADRRLSDDHPDHPDHRVEACWLAAEAAYRTCVAQGGAPKACELAMEQLYHQCIKGCK